MASGMVSGDRSARENRHSVIARWTFYLISLGGMIAAFNLFDDHVPQNVATIGWAAMSLTLFFVYRAKFNLNPPERPVTVPAVWRRKPDPSSDV